MELGRVNVLTDNSRIGTIPWFPKADVYPVVQLVHPLAEAARGVGVWWAIAQMLTQVSPACSTRQHALHGLDILAILLLLLRRRVHGETKRNLVQELPTAWPPGRGLPGHISRSGCVGDTKNATSAQTGYTVDCQDFLVPRLVSYRVPELASISKQQSWHLRSRVR